MVGGMNMTGIIHPGLFGVNLLYNQQDEHGQDLIENGRILDLVRVYKEYGFRYLRWPGGSVTENDACEDPKQFFTSDKKINLNELLDVCREYGFRAHIVVPTRVWRDGNAGMSHWLQKLREADHSLIATIEIGNEYWGEDRTSGESLTPVEYGMVARKLLPKLRDAVPSIPVFIQNAPHWTGDVTADIYGQLAKASTPVLAGAVDHYYGHSWAGLTNTGPLMAAMRERPEHLPASAPWALNVSEWNIHADTLTGPRGLDQGLALAQMLWQMAHNGVQWATFWGFHYRHLATKLQGYRYNGTTYDTAAGTMFRTFQDLIGYETVASPAWAGPFASTFKSGRRYVIYFKGPGQPSGVHVLNAVEFAPFDDPATANVDESAGGAQQQARVIGAAEYREGGYYMVTYEEAGAVPAGSFCIFGWLKRLFT